MRQNDFGVRVEWGLAGAQEVGPGSSCVVVVDVLSFSTSVTVLVERGTHVLPYPWREGAADFAAAQGAQVAVGRRAVTARQPWSLSPAALRRAPFADRLVLPSPNGSTISAAVSEIPVVVASLRNASAVANWIRGRGWGTAANPVTVIAAGEHWPNRDLLRPAVEDWLGAGAVVAALGDTGPLSPEAEAARASYLAATDLAATVTESASGRELRTGGFPDDVAIAVELESSSAVPLLVDGAFTDAGRVTGTAAGR